MILLKDVVIREERLNTIPRVAVVVFCLTLAAYGRDSKPQNAIVHNPINQQKFAKCHGKTAGGRFMGGPSLTSEKVTALSADELRQIITNGKHRMPKFGEKLSAAQIDALIDQIKSQRQSK